MKTPAENEKKDKTVIRFANNIAIFVFVKINLYVP